LKTLNDAPAFQYHTGSGQRVVFPNGHVGEVDDTGMFKTIIFMPKAKKLELMQKSGDLYDWKWECAVYATGSPQVVHQKTTVIGQFTETGVEYEIVLVQGGLFALPHEPVDASVLKNPLDINGG
jgi:hypothetical protein